MRLLTNKLVKMGVLGSFIIGGLVACNNSNEDNAGDRQPTTDTSVANNNVAPANPAATAGNSAKSASTAAAGASSNAKKRRTTVEMSSNNSNAAIVKDKDGVYSSAQEMPQFPGGQGGLDTYVNNSVDYPQQAIDNNTSGVVRVSFVVDENGKVTKAHILGTQKVGDGLDEEAVKVVNRMPTWKPGKVNGKNVKTRLDLPISFQVES